MPVGPSNRVLLTSVPAGDVATLCALLPEAAVLTAPLSADVVTKHPLTEVLSVMIHDRVDPALLDALPRLRGIVTRSDGYDHLPLEWCRKHGVIACNLGGYATTSVAHMAIAFIIALLRRVPEGAAVTRAGSWDRRALRSRHLHEATVGVLGTGKIGSEVCRILSAMGATVVGHDIAPDSAVASLPGFRYAGSFDALLAASDALTVHVPLKDDTRAMIGAKALAALPPGACLVNTARGAILDQEAVAAALASGRLAGYAADVLPEEPDPPHLRLFTDVPNALVTPHLAAWDAKAVRLRYEYTARAVRGVLDGDAAAIADLRLV